MLQFWFIANTVLWPFAIELGGLSLSLNVIALMLIGPIWLWRKRRIALSSIKVLLLLLSSLVFSVIVALNAPCNDKFIKSMITGPILIFLAFVGWEAGRRAQSSDWLNLEKTATWSLLAAFSAFLVEMAVPSLFPLQELYRIEGKFSGLFNEPSHVAFSLFPCIAVLLISESKKTRRRGFFALFGLLLFSRSSTLIALIAVWILYRLFIERRLRRAVQLGLGIVLVIGLGAATNYERFLAPTVSRIVGVVASSSTDNLSSLVYVQGWQDTWANLMRTHGLGLGFNMMGCHPLPDVPVREILAVGGLEELNAEDGSFQFGKIVSEAGVGGIVFYVAIIWWWLRLEKRIRRIEDNAARRAASTQAALIFCFVAASFIRGGTYFSGGLLLWLIAESGASKWQLNLTTVPAVSLDASDIGSINEC
jgi:hypothetical protein